MTRRLPSEKIRANRITMNEELIFSIEKLVYGGDGLGHADGNTVFVPYVLPGEQVCGGEKGI